MKVSDSSSSQIQFRSHTSLEHQYITFHNVLHKALRLQVDWKVSSFGCCLPAAVEDDVEHLIVNGLFFEVFNLLRPTQLQVDECSSHHLRRIQRR
jgi:hypothetical protein